MLSNRYLCQECVGDDYFKKLIKKEGSRSVCSYCNSEGDCLELEMVADKVDKVLRQYYRITSDNEINESEAKSLQKIIATMLKIDSFSIIPDDNNTICDDIVEILEPVKDDNSNDGIDPFYDFTSEYVLSPNSSDEYSILWNNFCLNLKHTAHFFNEEALNTLKKIFSGMDKCKTFGNEFVIKEMKPDNWNKFIIFRARQSDDNQERLRILKDPYNEMGSPPPEKTRAGRMNPAGIPVFYGSLDQETCIAEIRLPVGGFAFVGEFEIIRPIRYIDFTVLDNQIIKDKGVKSWFDPDLDQIMNQRRFLDDFHQIIAKPVLPCDEILDYLPTQAITEFLSNHFEPKLDGMMFSSTQRKGGRNLVLFNHARLVEPSLETILDSPKNEYEFDFEYERFIITKTLYEPHKSQFTPTLRFCKDSLKLVQASSIDYNIRPFQVIFYDNP